MKSFKTLEEITEYLKMFKVEFVRKITEKVEPYEEKYLFKFPDKMYPVFKDELYFHCWYSPKGKNLTHNGHKITIRWNFLVADPIITINYKEEDSVNYTARIDVTSNELKIITLDLVKRKLPKEIFLDYLNEFLKIKVI